MSKETLLLFSIPVYIQSEDQSNEQLIKKVNKIVSNLKKEWKNAGQEMPPEIESNKYQYYNSKYYTPWKYNKVIGWIEILYHTSKMLIPRIYFDERERYDPRSNYNNITPIFDINSMDFQRDIKNKTNNEIRSIILQMVQDAIDRLPRDYFYVDTEQIDNLLSTMDFSSL